MSSMSGSQNGNASNAAESPYQYQLQNFCRNSGIRPPTWQIVSDRRGGRTAWSSTVVIQGQTIQARFWYDGQFVNNAREDAAQMALQRYGQLPANGAPPSAAPQQQTPPTPSGQPNQQQGQQRYYGVIGK